MIFGDPGNGHAFGDGSGLQLTLRQPALMGGDLELDCVLQ